MPVAIAPRNFSPNRAIGWKSPPPSQPPHSSSNSSISMSGGKPKRHILRRGLEDKVRAALRVSSGCSRSEVGADMDVAESTLRGWIHEESIQRHLRELDWVVQMTLFQESLCGDDASDPDYLLKDAFDRAVALGRYKKGSKPMRTPNSCSRSVSALSTPSTSGSDDLHQCPEASLSHLSRKRFHSVGYDTDGSSSSWTAEYHPEKKMRIDVGPQYHLDFTMRLDDEQPSCPSDAETIEKGNVASLEREEGR